MVHVRCQRRVESMAVEGEKAELLAKALLDMEAAIANADRLKDNAKRYLRKLKELEALPWDAPPAHAMETKDNGKRLWLSHYAHRVWPAGHHGSYHFYGHSHGSLPGIGRSRDVGVDLQDMAFGPRRFEDLTKGME